METELQSTGHVVNFRGWPGIDHYRRPQRAQTYSDRLVDRVGLVYFAAALSDCTAERFGLGGWLDIAGRSVVGAGLVVPDNCDIQAFTELLSTDDASTLSMPDPCVVSRWDFFDPYTGTFVKRCYSGAGRCIGADLGRSFGLPAEHCGGRRGTHTDEWEVWLPGWGKNGPKGWKRRSPHRPALHLQTRRVGWQVQFGPCGKDRKGTPAGKRVRGRAWRGAFIDTMSLAYALDADRSASFAEHRTNFGLHSVELPLTVSVDAAGAARIMEALHAIHELVIVLDGRAAQWFTTARDRAETRGRLDLARTSSPGAIAAEVLSRFALCPPIETVALAEREHGSWTESFHGGWCDA
jgi:hypothetical protein